MEKFEQVFAFFNEVAQQAEKKDIPYLEGLLNGMEDVLNGQLEFSINASKDEMRKGIQIAILKGMRKNTQPNHQMTPDTLGLLISYFVEQFLEDELEKGKVKIADLALGTGNLVYTVMNALDGKIEASGVEVDELLIRLAAATAELLEQPISLYRQDALEPLLVDPVDAIVSDLPVGYYPNEDVALEYELCAEKGMSYSHHLFIEQSLKHTKEGGYLFLLVPASIFESDEAKNLHKFLKKHAWINAVIQLPTSLFSSKAHEKSILVLQKPCKTLRAPREVLLAKVPPLSNKQAMAMFFEKVQMWKKHK